jgi:outer membrane protein assembly factor BamB
MTRCRTHRSADRSQPYHVARIRLSDGDWHSEWGFVATSEEFRQVANTSRRLIQVDESGDVYVGSRGGIIREGDTFDRWFPAGGGDFVTDINLGIVAQVFANSMGFDPVNLRDATDGSLIQSLDPETGSIRAVYLVSENVVDVLTGSLSRTTPSGTTFTTPLTLLPDPRFPGPYYGTQTIDGDRVIRTISKGDLSLGSPEVITFPAGSWVIRNETAYGGGNLVFCASVFASNDRRIVRFSTDLSEQDQFTINRGSNTQHQFAIDAGSIYEYDGDNLRRYAFNGSEIWSLELPGQARLRIIDDMLITYGKFAKHSVVAVDPEDGEILWSSGPRAYNNQTDFWPGGSGFPNATVLDIEEDGDHIVAVSAGGWTPTR